MSIFSPETGEKQKKGRKQAGLSPNRGGLNNSGNLLPLQIERIGAQRK
jgi:hypothetical protein